MAIIRLFGRGVAVACAVSSVLAGCSSVERDTKLAATSGNASTEATQTAASNGLVVEYRSDLPAGAHPQLAGQPAPGAMQVVSADFIGPVQPGVMRGQPMVAIAKGARLPVPVPMGTEAGSVQAAAMAAPTMAPLVALAPAQAAASATNIPAARTSTTLAAPTAPWAAPATSTILASVRQENSASAKVGRLVSPGVAPGVTEGRIQPAAATAIALDEAELTPDMVALQSVIPIPRPDLPSAVAGPAPASLRATQQATGATTLAYAAQPHAVAALSAMEFPPAPGDPLPGTANAAPPELAKLIKRYAGLYGVPESLVHRVVHRESKYDPKAYHKNGYWGLMQIKYSTAKAMGYDGPAKGLLDAETNLKYAIKYLRGAWLVADNKNDNAIRLYARGYYYDAKRKDMLHVMDK